MGINYFPQNMSGPCQGFTIGSTCPEAAAATAGITKINAEIKGMAPVLNTQSYQWTFNPRADTMLKSSGGSYYIFSMTSAGGPTGPNSPYTFALPPGLKGSTVQVLNEGRSLPINAGSFTDTFAAEYAHHIYKITP
jgi:hypothetical protein